MILIPRLKPSIDRREFFAALRVSNGNISRFEEEFSKKFHCAFGTMYPHGRSGLYALFKVWGLENTEVICPAYTCVVVPHAIVLSGNIPVFVDCLEGSLNMSYSGIEEAITDRTRVVIVTHVFGYPMDVQRIAKIIATAEELYKQKIYVIQDVAYSFGAFSHGQMVTEFGDASLFGLNISKILTSIFGGMVITNDRQLDVELKKFRREKFRISSLRGLRRFVYLMAVYIAFNLYIYRIINYLERKGFLNHFVKYYDEGTIEFPNDWDQFPTEIEARVGLEQLAKYDAIISERLSNSRKWMAKLKDNVEITFFQDVEGSTFSHCVGLVQSREEWVKKYMDRGIQLGSIVEYSIPHMKSYQQYKKGDFPNSKFYSEHIINFPVWRGLPQNL